MLGRPGKLSREQPVYTSKGRCVTCVYWVKGTGESSPDKAKVRWEARCFSVLFLKLVFSQVVVEHAFCQEAGTEQISEFKASLKKSNKTLFSIKISCLFVF